MTAALALAAAELRRLLRDRTSLFFIVLLPIVIILLIGVTITGNREVRIAVVNGDRGPLARHLVHTLDAASGIKTRTDLSRADAATEVRRGSIAAAVVMDPTYDAEIRGGGTARLEVLVQRSSSSAPAVMATVDGAVAREVARLHAARFVAQFGMSFDTGLRSADRAAAIVTPVSVVAVTVDASSNILPAGFSYSAPTMLVLFVFINGLAGGAAIIQSRKFGVLDRALAGPARPRDLVLGETLTLGTLTLLQSALIIAIGGILFGVSWGNPLAATVLVGVWAVVGTGAGVLAGTLFRTPEQASSIGPAFGIAAGMLGGCMWPLEIVPPFMRTLGHIFPHAWAVDAWTELLSRGGGLADIVGQLGVLAAFAAVLLAAASWRLRRRLVA
jgi:ABC-2 type transport system permease protein